MKGVSIFFSIVLLFPILFFLLHILQLYDSKGPLKAFGISDDLIFSMAKPYIIWLVIYVIAFMSSIFLNIKMKYTVNVIFLSIMIVVYMFISYFLKHI